MPSSHEKKRRRELLADFKAQERANFRAAMPISAEILRELFFFIEREMGKTGCNHCPTAARKFLKSHDLNEKSILDWLGEHGGFCDCEILANVREKWESNAEVEKRAARADWEAFGAILDKVPDVPPMSGDELP